MELPKYLQTLLAYKWFLAVGVLLAIVVGLVATFTVQGGQITTRVARSYSAATTMMLSNPTRSIYQAEFASAAPSAGARATVEDRDLDGVAPVYAYIISGATVRSRVVAAIGPLGAGEAIQAVQRTTQPGADTTSQGRLSLPLIDVVGVSPSPARAERISQAAATAFQQYAVEQQQAQKMSADDRVSFTILDQAAAVESDGSNPAIPGVAAGLGVLVIFGLAVFVIDNIRTTRRQARAGRTRRPQGAAPSMALGGAQQTEPERELAGVGAADL